MITTNKVNQRRTQHIHTINKVAIKTIKTKQHQTKTRKDKQRQTKTSKDNQTNKDKQRQRQAKT